jgi:signal recognition particle GTPase
VADPTPAICAMLLELAGYNVRMMRLATEQAEAAGRLGQEEAAVLDIVSRSARRTLALTARLHADSQKTPEERAAERAERAAAAQRAMLREKKEQVARSATAVIKRASGPSDHEDLLGDMRERLLHPDIDIALLREDVSTVVLRVLKEVGIAPKQATMSDALMAHEITAASTELERYEAERAAGRAAQAAGVDWRVGVEFSSWPPNQATDGGAVRGAPETG